MIATDCIDSSWNPIVNLLYQEPLITLRDEILPNISYQPPREKIFKAFSMPVSDIRVVILGQDPYPKPGDATGYSFAISHGRKYPVSLRNIFKEVKESDPDNLNLSGEIDLFSWVDQGVFLLNTALTVETGKAGSHLKYWKDFTKRVISHISDKAPCIWLFLGEQSINFLSSIDNQFRVQGYDRELIKDIPINDSWNYIIKAPHPLDVDAFFGSDCFHYINEILSQKKEAKITW